MKLPCLALLPALCLLTACGGDAPPASTEASPPPAASGPVAAEAPVAQVVRAAPDVFLDALRQHCGQAFAGRIVANVPAEPNDPFAGKALVMHVRECGDTEVKLPFHVGDDHSRTWVITRTDTGLRLKHDHRHADGSEDVLTQYGGDTAGEGTAQRQEFPVDPFSIDLFNAQGRSVSTTNTWAIEIEPGKRYLYELSRPGGRLFQVEFDLSTPVDLPPTPWGHPPLEGDGARIVES
ncbi:hypothetical protein [Aquimonas voraii]|uniref:Lipoprotein n=1 Tax=Aquimonas voraii TaxID=265719 RepID=A0A1G6W1I0_9GAMM|nr:hypothetical protein [Aquimonas voraii]SDD59679.1 hypothetical protein SAMN04488509_10474 [Aquimonas voraii]